MVILDVSDPSRPAELGRVMTSGFAYDVKVVGGYAYVADREEGLRVIDVSDPRHPREVRFYDTPGYAEGVHVVGRYAYVADGDGGLSILRYTGAPSGVSASIVSYSPNDPNDPIRVEIGKSVTISVAFINTGDTAWNFIAGASIWDSNGVLVANYEKALDPALQPGQQTTVSWEHTVNQVGDYWLQFGLWKAKPFVDENLLDKEPVPSGKLIVGVMPSAVTISETREAEVSADGSSTTIGWGRVPEVSKLLQNYPNPFNPDTWIPYQLSKDAEVEIRIYTVTGQIIRTLNLGWKPAGFYTSKKDSAYWDGRNSAGEPVSSGVYFYTIRAGEFTAVRKMVMVR